MTSTIAFLLVFSIVVIVHEFGHFIAARKLKIPVYEFSIGFPFSPKVATLFRHRETEFTLRLLPLGGFVSFSKDGSEESTEFFGIERWKRAIIAGAGSVFNIAFAFIVLVAIFMVGKGLSFPEGIGASLKSIEAVTAGTFNLLFSLVSGNASFEGVSGPVGIAVIAGKAAEAGLFDLLYFTGMLSLSLGVFNLLPLPALDGGHLVMLAIETLKGGPLKENSYRIVTAMGFAFFLIITVLVTYKDILKLTA